MVPDSTSVPAPAFVKLPVPEIVPEWVSVVALLTENVPPEAPIVVEGLNVPMVAVV